MLETEMKYQFGEMQIKRSKEFDICSDGSDGGDSPFKKSQSTFKIGANANVSRKQLNQANLVPSQQNVMSQSVTSDFIKFMQDKQKDKMMKQAIQNNPNIVF